MSASDLLKLIENVDHTDEFALDEIDARVWCYLNKKRFDGLDGDSIAYGGYGQTAWSTRDFLGVEMYTRSRDALKDIRPEGWVLTLIFNDMLPPPKRLFFDCRRYFFERDAWLCVRFGEHFVYLPTEELAELHAIIQAIDYERTNS